MSEYLHKSVDLIRTILLLLVLTYQSGVRLCAQAITPYIHHLESVNGEPIMPTGNLVQDEMGFIWIPSKNGLLRYDGYELKRFDGPPKDTSAFVAESTYRLQQGKDGRLFMLSDYEGMTVIDPRTGRFERWTASLKDTVGFFTRKINEIAEEEDGSLWICQKGFHRWFPAEGRIEHFYPSELLGFSGAMALAADEVVLVRNDPQNHNYLWLGTRLGLMRFHKQTEEIVHFPVYKPSNDIPHLIARDMYFGNDGRIYLATWYDGMHIFDTTTAEWDVQYFFAQRDTLNPLHNQVSRISKKSEHELWVVAPYRGLFAYHTLTNLFTLITPHPAHARLSADSPWLMKGTPIDLLIARDGSTWLCLSPEGIEILFSQQQQFKKIVTETQVSKILEHPNTGQLFAFGASGKYFLFDLEKSVLQSYPVEEYMSRNLIEDGAFSSDGRLWLLGMNTFYTLQADGSATHIPVAPFDSLQRVPEMQDNSHASHLLIDRRLQMWVPLKRTGLLKIDPGTGAYEVFEFSHTAFGQSYPWKYPRAIIETDKQIWVGYDEGVCYTADGGDTWVSLPTTTPNDKHIEFRGIRCFEVDRYDRMWIGSRVHGLFYTDMDRSPDEPLHVLTEEDGLASADVYDLEKDAAGNLWIVTSAGLSRMDPEDFTCTHFGPEYGLRDLKRLTLLTSGEMAIAATGGFYLFHPDSVSQDTSEYLPVISEFNVFGDPIDTDTPVSYISRIDLKYDQNFFSFEFSAPNFWAPHLVQYQYQLVGVDPEWVDAGQRRYANYTDISPGKYTFQARASDIQGNWNIQSSALSLVIAPPWWATWWAYALYILFLCALLYTLYSYQRKRWLLRTQLKVEQEKAQKLTELDAFKTRFYTNITHEFRTPLTVIHGMTGQIEGHERLKATIRKNSDHLLNMVNELLDLSKLEADNLPVYWVQGDIVPYLQYLTESCHSLASQKHIHLAFFSREDRIVMDYDEMKTQQILLNILSNAIKFTPEYGSVKVITEEQATGEDRLLKLSVKDSGRGITEQELPYIFDRFYQADSSMTRSGEGAGIGLALVHELVELLDGRIDVKSIPGKGSEFMVFLPIHHKATKQSTDVLIPPGIVADVQETEVLEEQIVEYDKPVVLVIEDNADVVHYISLCLKDDYIVLTASNGMKGIEKAITEIPDVVVSDVMMPEKDGFEVCKTLKADRRTSHIPVILLTAKATQKDKLTGLTSGADAYLTKPFDKEELHIRLANLALLSKRLRDRLMSEKAGASLSSEEDDREAAFLHEVHSLVESGMSDELFDTNKMCKMIGLSRTQLHRKLKALTGQSTASYIRTIRLRRARTLLETTHTAIGDISAQVGFKDFSHFSRSFAREFGMTPSETRK